MIYLPQQKKMDPEILKGETIKHDTDLNQEFSKY